MITKSKTVYHTFQEYQGASSDPHSYVAPSYLLGVPYQVNDTSSVTHEGPIHNWRRKIAQGTNATTDFSGTEVKLEAIPGSATCLRRKLPNGNFVWDEQGGCMVGTWEHAANRTISDSAAERTARTAFINSIRDANTAVQGLVIAGEIGETIRMFMSPAKALRLKINDYFTSLKKRRRRSRSQNRRVLSSTYLEWTFGVRPLLRDIENANQALQDLSYRPVSIVRVGGFGEEIVSFGEIIGTRGFTPSIQTRYSHTQETQAMVIYRGGVQSPIGNRNTLQDARYLGFSLDNFLPSAWNLLPYSFVVDYFSNIGDVINAWSLWDTNLTWANKTTVLKSKRSKVVTGLVEYSNPDIEHRWCTPCSQHAERKSVQRVKFTGPLVPPLRFEVPGTTSLKWLNLAALADQHRRLTPYY